MCKYQIASEKIKLVTSGIAPGSLWAQNSEPKGSF